MGFGIVHEDIILLREIVEQYRKRYKDNYYQKVLQSNELKNTL